MRPPRVVRRFEVTTGELPVAAAEPDAARTADEGQGRNMRGGGHFREGARGFGGAGKRRKITCSFSISISLDMPGGLLYN